MRIAPPAVNHRSVAASIYWFLLLCRRGGKGRGAGVRHIEAGKEAAIEAEMQASRERAVIPVETRVQQFMEMLAEKQVFSFFSLQLSPQ